MTSNERLTLHSLLRVVRGDDRLPEFDYSAMMDAYDFAVDVVTAIPVYGRSTGVGANKSIELSETNSAAQDLRLLRSHAAGAGRHTDAAIVKSAAIIRLNQLLKGGAGVAVDAALALRQLIDEDVVPLIHEVGSLGTGDLSQMAELALTLIGERNTSEGRSKNWWTPRGGDALPFISSNAFTVAIAARVYEELGVYLDHYCQVAATSMYVTRSNVEPLAAQVQLARPQPGQAEAAARIRAAIGDVTWDPRRLQDTFGFRSVVPVLSTLFNAKNRLAEVIETEINSSPENPLIDADSEMVFHNGNFHTQQLAMEIESAALALFGSAQLSFNRTTTLSETENTGLPPFLADTTPGSSGTMMVEYIAASAVNSLRVLSQPASLSNTTVSRGTEDHAPFTAQAARQLLAGLEEARRILAVELLCSARGVHMLAGPESGEPRSAPIRDYIRRAPARSMNAVFDRPLSDDVEQLEQFVATSFETLKLRK